MKISFTSQQTHWMGQKKFLIGPSVKTPKQNMSKAKFIGKIHQQQVLNIIHSFVFKKKKENLYFCVSTSRFHVLVKPQKMAPYMM